MESATIKTSVGVLDVESLDRWLREEVWKKPFRTPAEFHYHEVGKDGIVTIFNPCGDPIALLSKELFDRFVREGFRL